MPRQPGPGRPRKPVEQHIAAGTYRPSRHGPKPVAGTTASPALAGPPPVKPAGLSPQASAAWDRIVAAVGSRLRASDQDCLMQLAEWTALFASALADAHAAGPKDRVKALTAAGIASTNWERLARKFGLSPEDRGRLSPAIDASPITRVRTRPQTALDRMGKPEGVKTPESNRK